jgi:hypothetical protein
VGYSFSIPFPTDRLPLSLASYDCLITLLRHDKDFLSIDNESDSTTDDETESLFNKSNDNTGDIDNTEILSNESSSNIDDKACLSDNKGLHPLEYYLAKVVSLDVKWLRQRRYSLKT